MCTRGCVLEDVYEKTLGAYFYIINHIHFLIIFWSIITTITTITIVTNRCYYQAV